MFNSGYKGIRAVDGSGIVTLKDVEVQQTSLQPKITSWAYTNGAYVPYPDTAIVGGETIVIYGSGFQNGANVYIGSTAVTSTRLDQNRITFTAPSQSAGSYVLYVVNPNGNAAVYAPGIYYNSYPVWNTTTYANTFITPTSSVSFNLNATDSANLTFTLQSGSLPTGLTLYPSGLISGTTTVANTTVYTFTAVATDSFNQASQASIIYTITYIFTDPYFNQTTLLLNGETNTNTYIQDLSTNNFALTPIGAATSNRFSPLWGGYYGNQFDGNTGYLSVSAAGGLLGSGNFTLECWVMLLGPSTNSNGGLQDVVSDLLENMGTSGTNTLCWRVDWGSVDLRSSLAAVYGVWYHLAVVQNGTTVTLYVNGSSANGASGTTTTSTDITSTQIGSNLNTSLNRRLNGYISNLRIVKGTALYTGNFTPSTTPLTAVAGTSLLTCQSPYFVDNSTNAYTISPTGTVKVVPNQPFGIVPTTATSNTNNAGYYSAQFDGSTGYLSTPSNTAFDFWSGNFTFECWVYPTGSLSNAILMSVGNSSTGSQIEISSGVLGIYFNSSGTNPITGSTLSVGTWSHVALSKSGTTFSLFLNGSRIGTSTSTSYWTGTTSLWIAANEANSSQFLQALISNVRLVKGTAIYDPTQTTLTVPTSPLSAVANTVLLTCQNSMIVDNSTNAFTLTPTGKVIVSQNQPFASPTVTSINTTPANYGCVLMDGSTGYISSNVTPLGAGNWTVEFWMYATTTSNQYILSLGATPDWSDGYGTYLIYYNTASVPYFAWSVAFNGNNFIAPPITNQWVHIAIVQIGTTAKIYLNGVAQSTTLTNTTNLTGSKLQIGHGGAGSWSTFNGSIANFRVVSGTAVYTNNFIPPNQPLTPVANTALLTLQNKNSANNNVFYDDSVNNFAITRTGTPTQGTFTPFSQTGWSNYFDGSSGYLSISSNTALNLSSGDFTIECWFYMTTGSKTNEILNKDGVSGTSYSQYEIYVSSSNMLSVNLGNGNGVSPTDTDYGASTSVSINAWHHVVCQRTGTTISVYLDGVRVTNTAQVTAMTDGGKALLLGHQSGASSDYFSGYISNIRIVKGTAVYSGASISVPTSPLTAIANTVLLTCQSNRFLDNSTNAFALTPSGTVQVQAFSPFAPGVSYSSANNGGSILFNDGSSNLSYGSSSQFAFGTANFTVEAWIYITSFGNGFGIFGVGGASAGSYGLYVYNSSGQKIQSTRYGDSAGAGTTSTILSLNTWYHIAAVRNNGTAYVYINGILDSSATYSMGSVTNSGANSGTIWNSTVTGTGYISNLRVTNNQATYITNFTPPTAPLTPNANTLLLLLGTNTGIQDATGKNDIVALGSAKTQANTVKFGSSAMYFDGSTGYLTSNINSNYQFGTGNFTVECWVNLSSLTGYQTLLTFGYTPLTAYGWAIQSGNGNGNWLWVYLNSTPSTVAVITESGSTVNTNTWYHIAVVRNGTTLTMYRNGVSVGTASDTGNYTASATLGIGAGSGTGFNNYYLNGYIDDLRITKGIARYTGNFTPPTVPDLTQ